MRLVTISWQWADEAQDFNLGERLALVLNRMLAEPGFRLLSIEKAYRTGTEVFGRFEDEDAIRAHIFCQDLEGLPGVCGLKSVGGLYYPFRPELAELLAKQATTRSV